MSLYLKCSLIQSDLAPRESSSIDGRHGPADFPITEVLEDVSH